MSARELAMSDSCATCTFAGPRYGEGSEYERDCRRFPKTPMFMHYMSGRSQVTHVRSEFPVMRASDWCGEFQAKEIT